MINVMLKMQSMNSMEKICVETGIGYNSFSVLMLSELKTCLFDFVYRHLITG